MSKINRHPVRRTAAGVLAGALVLSGAVATALPANAAAGFGFDRIAGNDRYETSAAVSARFRGVAGAPAITNVILASGESGRTPDALAASFLAGVRNAPVVVSRRDTIPEPLLAELRALRTAGATTLTVIGGTAAISDSQLTALRALGFTVDRLGGMDRYATARLVVAAGEGATASNVGLVASGVTTIDALAGGPLAYKGKHPMFLVTRTGIPASTLAAMRESGVTSVYILGGEAAVGPQVVAQLAAAGVTVTGRLAGADRSETSVRIAEALIASFGFTNTTFNLASGANEGIDALSGAALSGRENRAILVTNNATSAAPVVAFADRHKATLNAIGHIFGGQAAVSTALETQIVTAGGGTVGGSAGITITGTSAAAGSTFTGTLANPGTVQSVSVTGCGFNNQAVTVSSAGGFTLPVPAAQAVGACQLTFTVLGANGVSTTQVVPFTVTAPQSGTTAAPDLVSAAVNATTGVVTYTFDQDVTGQSPVLGSIYVYDAAGARTVATEASVSGSTLIARFGAGSTGTNVANAATLAALNTGAVADAAGRPAYAASASLGLQTQTAGRTNGPDLESVSNLRVQGSAIVADFRFDEPVDTDAGDVDAGLFGLIDSDGTEYVGNDAIAQTFSVDNRTVTVSFSGAVVDIPLGNIVRGVVRSGAVQDRDTTPNGNVTQTEPRTAPPAFTAGVLADRTAVPDLVSAVVAGTNVIQFTFDEAVNVTATPQDFTVYRSTGSVLVPAPAASAVRSSTDSRVVNVTFASGVVGSAVGVTVLEGAVTAVDNGLPNAVHELGLQAISNTAGRTGSPDLVSVRATVDAFGNNTVVFTFDEAVTVAEAALANFGLIDASGVEFTPTGGAGELGNNDTTVTFDDLQFSNAQAAAAVVGNFQDPTDVAGDPTTGDVPVQR